MENDDNLLFLFLLLFYMMNETSISKEGDEID